MTGVEMEWNCAITTAGESPVVDVVSGELYLSLYGVVLLQAYTIPPDVVSAAGRQASIAKSTVAGGDTNIVQEPLQTIGKRENKRPTIRP